VELGLTLNGKHVCRTAAPEFGEKYDAVVVGLGTAGEEAALVAAKLGLNVLGVEKHNAMGGQATIGCVNFGENIVSRMIRSERMADATGLKLAYETVPMGVWLDGKRVVGLRLFRNGVSRDVAARIVIDATGNATIARMAGCRLRSGRVWDGEKGACARAELWATPEGGMRPLYANYRRDLCGSAADYSAAVAFLAGTRHKVWNASKIRMLKPALLVGAREEERVETLETVTLLDCLKEKKYPNPIFYAFGPEDLARVDQDGAFESEEIQNWKYLCSMPCFGYPSVLPYGTIVARDVEALLVPSKHFGVSHDAGGGIRMQCEMRKTGYAAACATLLAVRGDLALKNVPYAKLCLLLEKGGLLKRPAKQFVTAVNGVSTGPYTPEQAVAALKQDVALPGEWWNSKADGGPREQAAYAYWTAWKCALSGSAAERQRFGDLLNTEMGRGGRWAGNFAVALGLLGDARACGVLRSLVATQGASHPDGADPVIACAYPNRIKAICLLGRLGDQASMPLFRDIVLDNAVAFTKDLLGTKLYRTSDRYRFEALSYALMSLRTLLERRPDSRVREELLAWNRKPLVLLSEREESDLSPLLKNIIR
jgi:hypothetical protein